MQYRVMGKTGKKVSVLGFGMMRLPILNNDTKQIEEEKAIPMVRHAIDSGINYIDTAWPYHGEMSETFTAKVLDDGYRDKVFIADKLPAWLIKDYKDFDFYLNKQLERLNTDHIDFYLLHALNQRTWPIIRDLGVLKWAEDKRKEGKIKHLGFSFHDKLPLFKEIVDAHNSWDFCQIQYNYMDTEFQAGQEGLDYAHERGLAIIVMEPLRGGQLAQKPPAKIAKMWQQHFDEQSYADGALQWVWNNPKVSLLLSGMTTKQHLDENLASANKALPNQLSSLDKAAFYDIQREYQKRRPIPCTNCGYCMPCPHQIMIPNIFNVFNVGKMYDDSKRAKFMYNFINEDGQADKCIQCGECEPKCPQQIPIMKWMKTVAVEFGE